MTTEQQIMDAINALNLFDKVRYLVAEADPATEPTALPICVLADGGRDYADFKTFCGSDLYIQTYTLAILAQTAQEVRDLTVSVSTALVGIVTVDAVTEAYDPDLRAYGAELVLT